MVGAAVPERQLERLQADGAAQQPMPQAGAEDGRASRSALGRWRRCSPVLPGRRDRLRGRRHRGPRRAARRRSRVQGWSSRRAPRGDQFTDHRGLDAGVDHGDQGSVAVAVTRDRCGVTTSRGPASPSPARRRSAPGPTSRARGRRRRRASPGACGCASTSERVSTPLIGGDAAVGQPFEPAALGRRARPHCCTASRMTAARAQACWDSIARLLVP